MKMMHIEREKIQIISEKMWFFIILKVTKKQCFSFSLQNTYFEKLQGEGGGGEGGRG